MSDICRVCKTLAMKLFTAELLGCAVQYFECSCCGYVQTEAPFWLDHAYAAAINDSDTGIMWRNRVNTQVVLMTLLTLRVPRERVVDFAGGYGLLVRQLRDFGVNALWRDKYCTNLVAKGFEHKDEPATLITAFEVFEHLVEPVEALEYMLTIAPNVLLSTEIMPTPTPAQGDWWYYGCEHGQHVGFYRVKTLQNMAERFGCRLITDGHTYHLFTRDTVPALVWQLGLKVRQLAPLFACFLLDSKTWQDHDLMVSASNSKSK
jgi:hypothetical protein